MATKPRVELTILVHTTYRLMVELDDIPADHDALMGMIGFCDPGDRPRPASVITEYDYRLDDVEVNGRPIIF